MCKIKDTIINRVTDDTDYGAPETSVAYRLIKGIEEQIGAPGSLGSEELEDYHAEPEDDKDTSDNYPEGWDEDDLNY